MIGNGEPLMLDVWGTEAEVQFANVADHNAALAEMGGAITSNPSVFVGAHPDQPTGMMISIYHPQVGLMSAFLDQAGLEIIADKMIATAPAPFGETLQ